MKLRTDRHGRTWLAALVLAALAAWPLYAAARPETSGAWEAGRPLTLGFPRLSAWWPDTERQSARAIARYDCVILGPGDDGVLSALRRRNPDIILLNSTNACELDFEPDARAQPWENEELARVPAQWLLTQVGAELARPIGAAATTLHVSRVKVTAGGVTRRLFVRGDYAVIDGELVRVRRVDAAARTLAVRRGLVWPRAAHAAGARLAAAVSFWPKSLVMDLSTYCPAIAVDSGEGPETWGEYNARVSAALVAGRDWDGLLVDRSDGDQSWLVGNSTARTIDPDRSNRPVDDGYAAFDAAWNSGLRRFEERLRAALGDGLIYANWGAPNYDLLNGNNFEGFPMRDMTAYGQPWPTTVFGPSDGGSYLDWLARARQPNLTTIQTYEDDGSPDPRSAGSYRNPAARKGFVPDYRKMRFGLCTALLGDGFFSYEVNTDGHGSLGLLWFDEFDAGGRGRGYLGRPLGPAARVAAELRSPNQATGGGFETAADLVGWDWWTEVGCDGAATLDGAAAAVGAASVRLDVTHTTGADWRASLSRAPVAVRRGAGYTLRFWAKADRARTISAWVEQTHHPWKSWIDLGAFRLTSEWREYEVMGRSGGGDRRAALVFGVGERPGAVWLDGVRLQRGGRDVWRRDYEGGIVVVNATAGRKRVELSGVFRKLPGRQVPAVNDGKRVSRVTLPPRDGMVLLRTTPAAPPGTTP